MGDRNSAGYRSYMLRIGAGARLKSAGRTVRVGVEHGPVRPHPPFAGTRRSMLQRLRHITDMALRVKPVFTFRSAIAIVFAAFIIGVSMIISAAIHG